LKCGVLTRRAEGYCVDCQPPYSRRKQRSGGAQRAFRERVFKRYGRRCVACGSTENIDAHHEWSLSEGGDIEGEGVPLCSECHRGITIAGAQARERARRDRME
jgi:hypothetical protein